ncbi:MAG TPA: ABC transporter ATP-binding protein [Lachnospiraceae bacterium]|nr:ABC transporter ATP-binding protein [Lachnospiraceae bacterium]
MSIEVRNLNCGYRKRKVLNRFNFSVEESSFLCVLGPNGVGKSTLFKCLLGLHPTYEGSITIDGKDIRKIKVTELAKLISYVPQSHHPTFNYTVLEMVLMGTSSQFSSLSSPRKEHMDKAYAAMEKVGIEKLSERGFAEISGGERQLALIARALAQQARTLIMDEPTANLDYGNQLRVLQKIRELVNSGYTVIQSTHNPDQALLFADQVLAISEGKIIAEGSPTQIITSENIRKLYQIDIIREHLCGGKIHICVPKFAIDIVSQVRHPAS